MHEIIAWRVLVRIYAYWYDYDTTAQSDVIQEWRDPQPNNGPEA